MKIKLISIIILVLMILLNLYLNKRIRICKNEIEINRTNLNYKENKIRNLENSLSDVYQSSIIDVNEDSIRINCPGLFNLLDSDKIVIYVQKGVCGLCTIKLLQDLSILEEHIGRGNVVIATNAGEKNHPFMFTEFDFPTFYIRTFNFPERYRSELIVFILNSQMEIKLFFLPELNPQFKDIYFNEYIPSYFKLKVHKSFNNL